MLDSQNDDLHSRLNYLERSNRRLRLAITTLLLTLIVVLAGSLAFGLSMRTLVAVERRNAQQAREEAMVLQDEVRAVMRQMVDQQLVVQQGEKKQ
jgi:hypothetical protein